MNRFRAGLAVALFALAGCESERPAAPPTLPPPLVAPPPEPQPDPGAIPVGFGGVLPPSGMALTLHPGTEFVIPVMAEGDLSEYVRSPDWTGIPVRVVTDAPADVLAVPAELSIEGGRDPDLLTIRALEPEGPSRRPQTYEVRLEPPHAGFPELSGLSFRVDSPPVQVRVSDRASAADCGGLSLAAGDVRSGDGGAVGMNWFADLGSEYRSADVSLRSTGRNVELRLLADYQQLPYGDYGEAYNLVPVMFAFDLDLEGREDGLEQAFSLAWFDELRLRAAIPGCTSIELHCADRGRCRVR